jgi:hypothetical protein
MSWSVACFCGNVYTAPPDRCEVCGSTVECGASKDAASHRTQNGAAVHGLAARCVPVPVLGSRRAQYGRRDRSPGR